MGVDVAAGGRDNTCWTIIDQHGIIEQLVLDTPQTMEICGRTIRLMQQYGLPPSRVAMDAGGGGKQLADRLDEQGYSIRVVHFAEGATSTQAYPNRRAEMYSRLRELLDPDRPSGTFQMPPTAVELRQELAAFPLSHDSEGRLQLPHKELRNGQRGHFAATAPRTQSRPRRFARRWPCGPWGNPAEHPESMAPCWPIPSPRIASTIITGGKRWQTFIDGYAKSSMRRMTPRSTVAVDPSRPKGPPNSGAWYKPD